jgi:catechol 2,3-dioxygenase-like lactoylglutathione lyase family enzyme
MQANALDHVALWVADRDSIADLACEHLGMHVIERTDDFTLIGADARRGKLTLFAAEGPRERGVLERVVLRVADLDRAVAALPPDLELLHRADGAVFFDGPDGLGLGLVARTDPAVEYDIDHVVLRVPQPAHTAAGLAELGFEADGDRLIVGDKFVTLDQGAPANGDRPLLNHIALLVDSGQEQLDEAHRRGLDVAEVRDAPNTFAVFVWGPDRIKLEYVEHKPTFSLV